MFEAGGEPDQVRTDSGPFLLFFRKLGVDSTCGMNGEALRITHICQMGKEFEPVDEIFPGFFHLLRRQPNPDRLYRPAGR